MKVFALIGICACLVTVSSSADQHQFCTPNAFAVCAFTFEEIRIPDNLNRVCEILESSYKCVKDLWNICGYDCSNEFNTQAYTDLQCTIHDKHTSGPMNRTGDPCTIQTQIKKCLDYNCPSGEFFPHPVPDGFSPNLGALKYTDNETREFLDQAKCPLRSLGRNLRSYSNANSNHEMCELCPEIKLNWPDHFTSDLSNPSSLSACRGSTIEQLVVEILRVGANNYIGQCAGAEMTLTLCR